MKIESTGPTIAADWQTKIGLAVAQRFPYIVEKGSERFVEKGEATVGRSPR